MGVGEALSSQGAAVAVAAGQADGSGVVAGVGEGVVDAEGGTAADDFGFGEMEEGSMNEDGVFGVFGGHLGGEVGEGLEGGDELGAAVGVAGVVECVDADEDVAGAGNLGEGEGEAQEDGVAGGNVGDGDAVGHVVGGAVLGDVNVGCERAAAEGPQVDVGEAVMCVVELGELGGCGEFVAVALAVVEGEGMEGIEAGVVGDGEAGGRVEAAGEENERWSGHGGLGGG